MSCTNRSQVIDLMRGMAILLVLLLHFQLAYHLGHLMDSIAGNGNYGVTMFFVISGFLITSISLERYQTLENMKIWQFYGFRFARIMPCLFLVLSIIVLLHAFHLSIFQNQPVVSFPLTIFSVLTFWHNILMQYEGYFNYCINIYWSLSVEEVFYITFPLIAVFLKKERYLILFWVLIIILGPIYRSFHTDNDIYALYGNFSCFDAISAGCLAAILAKKIKLKHLTALSISFFVIVLMVFIYFYEGIMDNVIFGISIIALGTGVILVCSKSLSQLNINKFFLGKSISWLGRRSYELYLFHIIVLAILKTVIPQNLLGNYEKFFLLILFLILSSLVAGFFMKYFSEPMNNRLRIYFKSLLRSRFASW